MTVKKTPTLVWMTMIALTCALSLSVTAQEYIVSPDNPEKMIPVSRPAESLIPPPESLITIACLDDVAPTGAGSPFTCFTGVGPFPQTPSNFGLPDTWNYHRGTCSPGDPVLIEVYRTNADSDPIAQVCEGDFCGLDNTGWGPSSCPGGSALLAMSDDAVGPFCAGGGFSDPSLSFVCPPGGVFTLGVAEAVSGGPAPESEIHATGVNAPAVPATSKVGLGVLILLILGTWIVMYRKRRLPGMAG